jgi:SSS family solute:Na+ symporter
VGQVATLFLVGCGLLWIPLMKYISAQLYVYLQSVQAYISPPIAAVFLIGIAWKRVNAHGAMASLIAGFVIGMGRLVAELQKDSLSGWLYDFATINFLHFAILLFAICTVVLVVVSLLTPEPSREKLAGLTFATAEETTEATPDLAPSEPAWKRRDLWWSLFVVACVALVWLYFTG